MASQPSSLLNIREQGYELASKLAYGQLAGMDMQEVCRKTGSQYIVGSSQMTKQPVAKILVQYISQPYVVALPDGEISLENSGEQVSLRDKILILHYLTLAKGTPAANKLITFRQLPGCASYFPVFHQLAIRPLLNRFGKEPELLIEAAGKLGGQKANYGDVSVTINAFSRVPVTIALWRGDDEFAPRASIMLDSSISDYLSAEDIRELCTIIARKLVKNVPSSLRINTRL